MSAQKVGEELEKFKEYLRSESNEDAKRHLLYPLFKKLFKDKFKIESDTYGADIYVEGQLIVEAKSDQAQWLEGFYQALHYHKKFGLSYNTIIVVAHKFIAIWKLNKLPEYATILSYKANAQVAPNAVGKENARRTSNAQKVEIKDSAFYWLTPKDLEGDIFLGAKNLTTESFEILKILNNLDSDRVQINTHNFINAIDHIKSYFEHPIDAVHAFYTMVAYWDITSTVAETENGELRVVGFKGNRMSESIKVSHKHVKEFRKYIETQYVFTNEGSGLTVDYYFSRFDEVLAKIDPEYVKQHGIFFTNDNLSKFALWFVKENFSDKLDENYIVFDPAGGSGNLVSSWHGKLKHKIVSELQPDLLKIIERRMKVDPFHVESGFTIIPKTSDNEGLNFLDRSSKDYLSTLERELKLKNISLDKPIAFLLNPPYKNTDENVKAREETASHYNIHPSIIELTGEDAGKERYLAFLGQILNIAKEQVNTYTKLHPVVMIFTPTSWLIPRPTYIAFREKWDKHFKFHSGFLVTSNEWFKLDGKWPLAFTIWIYNENEKGNNNTVKVLDLTELEKQSLNINWNTDEETIRKEIKKVLRGKKNVVLNNTRGDIRDTLPEIKKGDKIISQTRYDFSTAKQDKDKDKLVSGFPLKDEERHFVLKRKCGNPDGEFVGFMDDCTPVRVKQDSLNRMSIKPDRVWFRLDTVFINLNQTKVFNGCADNRSYCGYDLPSAKSTFSWFAITKALNGVYPVWANQYDIWSPNIKKDSEKYWHSLCFAFVLAENRCVVTKFEKDNPVKGAPEVFVDNPLCPANKESFWSKVLDKEIISKPSTAKELVDKIKELYRCWNLKYCKGDYLRSVGLQDEPYFKYFDYPDFLTPHSGLIQIRKYAELEGKEDLLKLFKEISELSKKVKEEIYWLLVNEFKYFE
ncbi:MAG: hypothetical protein EPN85_01380 [Bacteroidetes bacterium]|nr:MAG: hypothetical protein EPN85_01380 [Bacteroidota bacterium]